VVTTVSPFPWAVSKIVRSKLYFGGNRIEVNAIKVCQVSKMSNEIMREIRSTYIFCTLIKRNSTCTKLVVCNRNGQIYVKAANHIKQKVLDE
jgi:hypothetical protein